MSTPATGSMGDLLILARLLLAVTFAVAGAAKLRDAPAFSAGLQGLGVPKALQAATGRWLPWAELTIAALLLWSTTAWAASVLALALLLLFTAIIAHQLMQGRRPACNCFGQAAAAPISNLTLARNVALTGCAAALVAASPAKILTPPSGPLSSLDVPGDTMLILLLFLCSLLAVSGFMLFQLMSQQGRLLLRIDNLELRMGQRGDAGLLQAASSAPQGLEVGTLAPAFSAPLLQGGSSSMQALLQLGRPVVLVFSDPECGPCQTLAPRLVQWERELAERLTIALVSRGDAALNIKKFGKEQPAHVFLQADREVAYAFKVFATPSAVRINTAGLIDTPLALADLSIDELVHEPMPEALQPFAVHPQLGAGGLPERHSMA